MSSLQKIVTKIQDIIASYYFIEDIPAASDHMVSDVWLQQNHLSFYQQRGAVVIVEDKGDSFVGVHFHKSIRKRLYNHNPEHSLTQKNLDAFCVLIEEVSHFIRLAAQAFPVKHVDLEVQAEIDKMLVCALWLQQQVNCSYLSALSRLIYDAALIDKSDKQHIYWHAHRIAARFWHDALRNKISSTSSLFSYDFRSLMRHNYFCSVSERAFVSDS